MLDNSGKEPASRQAIIGALAAARPDDLAKQWQSWPSQPDFEVVRGPETGLVMVRGRAGGGGSPFNVGEVTVTRATVRLDTGEVGHAYALGRDGDKARLAAVFDALWQRPADRAAVEQLVAQLQARADAADDQRRQETAATRVNFFTMVRGDD
jgi:alpha-D-ribose 1-methylphosphonate 5-triphosphate synthase subunit PhnG